MSDVSIDKLMEQIANLNERLANANNEAKQHRLRRKKAVEELNDIKSKYDNTSKELERYKAEPSELQTKLDQLQGEIRTGKHKSRFSDIAKSLKVRDDAMDDLWVATGWKAEGDDPDVDLLTAAVKGALEKRPYMVLHDEATPQAPTVLQPGPATGRGQPVQPVVVDDHRFRDPQFMYEHGARLAEAARNGNLVVRN